MVIPYSIVARERGLLKQNGVKEMKRNWLSIEHLDDLMSPSLNASIPYLTGSSFWQTIKRGHMICNIFFLNYDVIFAQNARVSMKRQHWVGIIV